MLSTLLHSPFFFSALEAPKVEIPLSYGTSVFKVLARHLKGSSTKFSSSCPSFPPPPGAYLPPLAHVSRQTLFAVLFAWCFCFFFPSSIHSFTPRFFFPNPRRSSFFGERMPFYPGPFPSSFSRSRIAGLPVGLFFFNL